MTYLKITKKAAQKSRKIANGPKCSNKTTIGILFLPVQSLKKDKDVHYRLVRNKGQDKWDIYLETRRKFDKELKEKS